MKISVLMDNSQSWFVEYISEAIKVIKAYDKRPHFFTSQRKLKSGDILFILSCDKILNKKQRSLHVNNIVIHASNLPQDRGWSPWTWQIERGEDSIVLTLFEAGERVDAGRYYYLKERVRFKGTELVDGIRQKLAGKIIFMIKKYLSHYPVRGRLLTGKSSYNRRRIPKDNRLDIDKSIVSQFNKMRVADNERYPLYFRLKGEEYIIKIYKRNSK